MEQSQRDKKKNEDKKKEETQKEEALKQQALAGTLLFSMLFIACRAAATTGEGTRSPVYSFPTPFESLDFRKSAMSDLNVACIKCTIFPLRT